MLKKCIKYHQVVVDMRIKKNMSQTLISILVPIYKVEPYLRRCIDSVLTQSFQDWELILVDDGSPDKCPAICDEYAKRDKRIKVIHKPNGGLVSARLVGFQNACGEFLIFLDSDDWLLPNALSVLYKAITSEEGIDIVRGVVKRFSEDGKEWIEHYDNEADIMGKGQFLECLMRDSISPYLHTGIYRSSLFSESSFLPLIENSISVGEDWITNYYIAPQVSYVKFIDTPTFAYFLNTSSMMGDNVYGWEYYAKIEKCMEQINNQLGIVNSNDYIYTKALRQLRFFFIPEIPFDRKHFYSVYSLVIKGLNRGVLNITHIPQTYSRFIRYKWIYILYMQIYKLAFTYLKLKGHKRKVLK